MIKKTCLDCDKEIFGWTAKRCHGCANKIIGKALTGKKLSEEHKAKLKSAWNYDKHITPSWREKQKEIHKGKPVVAVGSKWSDEHRKHMMERRKDMYTDEWKKKNSEAHRGDKAYQWKGGKIIQDGYVFVLIGINKYRAEHRLVMEKHLGRELASAEQVHHIDFNKQNNKIDNLMLFPDASSHTKHHKALDRKKQPVL